MKRILPPLVAALVLLSPAVAGAATKPDNLWATVNVCDTARHPNKLGVRARMPGNGKRKVRMYMRFTAQFRTGSGWKAVRAGRSRWIYAGSAFFGWKEVGFTFTLSAPKKGSSYLTRGLVQMQWRTRRKGHTRVVRRARVLTQGGHPGTRNADPKGYTAATCRIATPSS